MAREIDYQPKVMDDAFSAFRTIRTLSAWHRERYNELQPNEVRIGFEQILIEAERMLVLMEGEPKDAA